ncbi:MAG: type II toxin-antitoxin system RelE/ParE family toxin [Acidithiobacillus sp.]|jgi:toxin ParE1/3/4|nr:type II toxin-antitoxin system RelE/ParE family toxin [Acidithiobacillus sp.]
MATNRPLPVIWTPRASAEYLSAVRYIAEERPAIAIEQGELVRQATGRLADYPQMGRAGRRRGTRELVVPGTPFIVVYRIQEQDAHQIQVIRFLHGAQQWP